MYPVHTLAHVVVNSLDKIFGPAAAFESFDDPVAMFAVLFGRLLRPTRVRLGFQQLVERWARFGF
jgi:hypothetical protein